MINISVLHASSRSISTLIYFSPVWAVVGVEGGHFLCYARETRVLTDKSLHGLMVSGPCDDGCSHSVEDRRETRWRERERVRGIGTEQQQKSVNPSIHFLLRFQHSQSFPGRQRLSRPPLSYSFIPGTGSRDGWAVTEQRCVVVLHLSRKGKMRRSQKERFHQMPSAWMQEKREKQPEKLCDLWADPV